MVLKCVGDIELWLKNWTGKCLFQGMCGGEKQILQEEEDW